MLWLVFVIGVLLGGCLTLLAQIILLINADEEAGDEHERGV